MKSIVFAVLAIALVSVQAQSIDECLQKDSISCVQKSLFRKAKEFFDKDSFDIVSGVSLVKASGRSSRSGKDLAHEQEIDAAENVADRQAALENFVGEEVSDFFYGRSLRINFLPAFEKIGQTARALTESVPTEIKEAANEVVEGRGKKKIFKKILPLLLLAKAKLGALGVLSYFALALIAKKAIIVSLISLAISAFIGLRGFFSGKGGHGHDTTGYSSGWASTGSGSAAWSAPASSGWSAGGSSGGWEDNSQAHNQAFSGYHH